MSPSCADHLPGAREPGTMPSWHIHVQGRCHGVTSVLLPVHADDTPLAVRHAPCGVAQRSPPALVSTSPSAVAASRQRRVPDNATREKAYETPVPLSEAHRGQLAAQRWQTGVCGTLVRGQQVAPAGVM